MYKFLVFIILSVTYCEGSIIKVPANYNNRFLIPEESVQLENVRASLLMPHFMDFLKLVDFEQVMGVVIQNMQDPEVMDFLDFILSPKFKEIIWEIETLEEFQKLYMYLSRKGYDIEAVINYINSALNLPAFEKPLRVFSKTGGLTGFIEALIDTLPLEDMKKLFEEKLKKSPEFAEFIETLTSTEFIDILKRLSLNPKIAEMRTIFESYGLDISFICTIIRKILGDNYQGIICEAPITVVNFV